MPSAGGAGVDAAVAEGAAVGAADGAAEGAATALVADAGGGAGSIGPEGLAAEQAIPVMVNNAAPTSALEPDLMKQG